MVAAALAGCQSGVSTRGSDGPATVKICSGFGCEYSDQLAFSAKDLKHMRKVLNRANADAKREREAISSLVSWKERLAQSRLRLRRDRRLSYQRDRGIRGQMDCVDESANTLAFLKLLDRHGMLRFHKPTKRIATRGLLFDGRYPHKTAVMVEDNGTKWAVDSWKKHGGEPPQIVEHAIWKKERGSEYRKPE